MDPATFDFARASAYAHLGVNRASVGAQSFDDSLLSACRRIHNTADIYRAIHTLRKARIPNISLDLISGLPNQTSDAWRHSLRSAIDLHPDHIAAYDLTLEEGTPFAATFRPGLAPLPQEHTTAEMMQDAARILTHAGYEHYEISNFARVQSHAISPFRSRHNMAYWCNKPFYGFGLGATSLVDGFRFARPRRMRDYQRYVEDLERGLTQGGSSVWQSIYPHALPQTSRERQEDFFINSFRLLVEGVQIHLLESLFGTLARRRFEDAIRRCISFVDDGLLEILYNNKGDMACIRLTEKGALVENSILSSLIQEALWKFPEEEALAP